MKKRILKIIICGIIGYLLFNIIISLTEVFILNCFNVSKNIFLVFIDNFGINLSIYIVLYFLIVTSIFLYARYIVRKLNDKLKKMRERRNINE